MESLSTIYTISLILENFNLKISKNTIMAGKPKNIIRSSLDEYNIKA